MSENDVYGTVWVVVGIVLVTLIFHTASCERHRLCLDSTNPELCLEKK